MDNRSTRAAMWLVCTAASLVTACAAPYVMTRELDARYGLGVGDGVRLAARAMQAAGYFPTQQNDAAGRIIGERNDKDSFGTDLVTLYVEANVSRGPKGGLVVNTTCSVSTNIVYTDQLDDECEKFGKALDKLIAERDTAPARVQTQTVVPRPVTPAPRGQPPAALPPASQPPARPASQGRDYSL